MRDLISHLTFTHMFRADTYVYAPINGVLWTVGLEVQFYVLFPLLTKLFRKSPLLFWGTLTGFGALFIYQYALKQQPINMQVNQLPTFLPVFANGMLAAYLFTWYCVKVPYKRLWGVLFTALAIVGAVLIRNEIVSAQMYPKDKQIWQLENRIGLSLCFTLFLVSAALSLKPLRWLFSNPVARFLISYNLYLYHQRLIVLLRMSLGFQSGADVAAAGTKMQIFLTVEALGLECVNAILKEDKKAALLELLEKDKAEEANALSIEEVDKVLRLNKHFYRFLNNYVVLADFYDPARKAIFQAGRLYIDQRSTDLCVKVAGPAPEISSLSGMYILYCACTSEKLGKSFNIAAVLTDGDVDGLREGKNAVFYDRDGNDYTAKVVAIVDNPISIRQAFWTPYRKLARMINDRIDKKAAEKNEKSMSGLTSAADTATEGKAPAVPFDIGKFAGIFAAIGMAVGLVGAALAGIVSALKGITFWQILLILGVLMLLISGPSMFIAWRKIRRRDLGPVLNANGWAINAAALVRAKFGKTLTSLAQFPKLTAVDPEARKKANVRKFWGWFCGLVVVACVALWLCNVLAPIGIKSPLSCYKEVAEAVEEAPAAEAVPAEAESAAAEEVPAQ